MRILVVYASKCGSTKGIAEFVGEKLRERGLEADVMDAGTVRDVAGYDAFVVGSALYMFHWLKQAKRFVSRNRAVLSSRPVWLFSSGPVGTEATDAQGRDLLETSGPKELDELRAFLSPLEHRVFFGALDGTRLTGAIGFVYRMAQRSQAAREAMPEGDFRDWKGIEAWAAGIAQKIETAGLSIPR